jgi:methylenetetrahydrofolate dehydrogenase (NADP+)/methenyltetrahydrofolate cyclohydrolase
VGNNPASNTYIKLKRRKLESLGFNSKLVKCDDSITEQELLQSISDLNNDPQVNGIILQLPLPANLSEKTFLESINPDKDVDCLNSLNLGTPLGVISLLKYYNIDIASKNICIVGRSNLVGKPLAVALTALDATVTLCHSKTDNLQKITSKADVVILAVGKPQYFSKEYFNSKQVVIDVGTSKNINDKLVGDADFDGLVDYVEAITPVPGGVGPMTIYGLVHNLVALTNKQRGLG